MVCVASAEDACFSVEVPSKGFTYNGIVPKDSVVCVALPLVERDTLNGLGNSRSVLIESSRPVSAYFIQNDTIVDTVAFVQSACAASTSIPLRGYGTKMTVFHPTARSVTSNLLNKTGRCSVVSQEDSNLIAFNTIGALYNNISGMIAAGGYQDTILLNRGDQLTYWIILDSYGSSYESLNSKGILGMHNGHFTPHVYDDSLQFVKYAATRDQGYEYQYADKYAGSSYHLPPINGFLGVSYTIMSLAAGNEISINGSVWRTLGAGEVMDTTLFNATPAYISGLGKLVVAAHPIYHQAPLVDYRPRFVYTGVCDSLGITRSVFTTFDLPNDTACHYSLALCAPDTALGNIFINGAQVQQGNFTSFSQSAWSYANIELAKGVHVLESSVPIQAILHTWYSRTPDSAVSTVLHNRPEFAINLPQVSSELAQNDIYPTVSTSSVDNAILFSQWNDTLCVGEMITVNFPAEPTTFWSVDFGDGSYRTMSSAAAQIEHSYRQGGSYWVKLVDLECSFNKDSLLIWVHELEETSLRLEAIPYCSGMSIEILNDQNNIIGCYIEGELVDCSVNHQIPWGAVGDSVLIKLIVSNGNCMDTVDRLIHVPDILLNEPPSNVITPNGDGVNDEYCVGMIPDFADRCFELIIRNRWGHVVFRTANSLECWSPQTSTDGVYFIEARIGEKQIMSGTISVMR